MFTCNFSDKIKQQIYLAITVELRNIKNELFYLKKVKLTNIQIFRMYDWHGVCIILIIQINMSRVDINNLIDQLTKNQKFIAQISKSVSDANRTSQQKQEPVTFAFQKAGKYPWSILEGSLPVEGQKMVEQITDMFAALIDAQLHDILNREFLNISNEILIIREEVSQFTKQEVENRNKLKEQFNQQIQTIKRRMIVQQNMNSGQKEFVRTRATGILNSSTSSNFSNEGKSELKMDVDALKKQVQILKRQMNKSELVHTVNDRLVYLQDHLKHELTDLKIKIESIKQKAQRSCNQIAAKMNQSNSKQQIKRAVKSHFKVYLQQINICKSSILKLQDSIPKLDKSLQEYVANQLKALWVVVGNMKRRVQSIQQSADLHNQSFMM